MNTAKDIVTTMIDLSFPLLLLGAGIATLFLYARSMKKNFKRIDHHLVFLGILVFLVPNILFLFSVDIAPTTRLIMSGLGAVSVKVGATEKMWRNDVIVGW